MSLTNVTMSDQEIYYAIASAFRITLSPHEWTWTQDEQEKMAHYILWLSRRQTDLELELRALRKVADAAAECVGYVSSNPQAKNLQEALKELRRDNK